jgi:hypothetical protein
MTEAEWLASTNPMAMLDHVRPRASARKLRLFAVAGCRRIWFMIGDKRSRKAVETSEQCAEGLASSAELAEAAREAAEVADVDERIRTRGWNAARTAAMVAQEAWAAATRVAESAAYDPGLVRCLFGNPFRPLPPFDPTWLSWNDGTVIKLAQAIYEERRFADLPILADALEEAGCTDEDILTHCREGGEHARGCWVLDLVLGKE